jgi:hypothetical protein
MPEWPELVVRPPARCFGRRADRPGRPCGRRALWMRPSKHGTENQFFCDECKRNGDEIIPPDALFRRVTVSLDIELAAADLTQAAAHAEAVARVEELVQQAGALLNLHRITSVVGRPAAQARPAPAPRAAARV